MNYPPPTPASGGEFSPTRRCHWAELIYGFQPIAKIAKTITNYGYPRQRKIMCKFSPAGGGRGWIIKYLKNNNL